MGNCTTGNTDYNLFELKLIIDGISNESLKKECLDLIPVKSTHVLLVEADGKTAKTKTILYLDNLTQQFVEGYNIADYLKYLGKSPSVKLYFTPTQELVFQRLQNEDKYCR
jgi:hypothetical protein